MHASIARRRTGLLAALATFAAAVAVVLLVPSQAFAQTVVFGGTVVDQTWTPAGSPYIVQGDITVPPGAFLNIQAGTVVQVANSDMQTSGLDPARVEITIYGSLTVAGTTAQPVSFTGASASAGSWYGIVIGATSTMASIANASIEYATTGLSSDSLSGTVSVSDTQVRNVSASGVSVSAGGPTFTNLTIASALYGISVTGSGSPTFTTGSITGSGSAGVSLSATSASTTNISGFAISGSTTYGVNVTSNTPGVAVNLVNDTITRNGNYGLYVSGSNSLSVSVRNSIITQQTYGVYRNTSAGMPVVNVTYSDVWGDTAADYSSASAGTGSFSANPILVSTSNLRLTSNSPARFASDANSDIGALPYVNDPTPGLYGTLWNDTHLTTASSPYALTGDLTVPPGVTLSIDPGVTMTWSASTDIMGSGANVTRGELIVRGTLDAAGTPASRITLGSSTNVPGSWYGVELLSTTNAPAFAYANITGATNAVTSTGVGGASIDHLTISASSAAGVVVNAGAPTFTNLSVTGGPIGISVTGSGSPRLLTGSVHLASTGISVSSTSSSTTTIDGFAIDSSSMDGINVTTMAANVTVNIVRATLNRNGNRGIYVAGPSSLTVSIQESIVTNTTFGVGRQTAAGLSVVTVTYSDVWGNGLGMDYSSVTPGTGCFSVNPLYVSNSNLRLTSNSPARYASASRTDIGALPYVSDPTPGLYGTLWVDTRLTTAGSPYALAGDLTVAPGVTLTIDPGVTLTWATTDIMKAGVHISEGELRVYGALAASGTATSPITMNSTTSAAGSWWGVLFYTDTSPPTLTNATITGATDAMTYSGAVGATITDVAVNANSHGIVATSGRPTFQRITINGASDGVAVRGTANPTFTELTVLGSTNAGISITTSAATTVSIVNSVIAGSAMYGVYVSPTVASAMLNVNITNCTIHANGAYGVDALGQSSVTVAILNSLITLHTYGVSRVSTLGTPFVAVTYSDVWSNTTNYRNVTGGIGTLSLNPLYANAPADLHVRTTSPVIDTASAVGAPDHDRDGIMRPVGAGYDMGAYEYVAMPVCGNGMREGIEACDDGARNGTYNACNSTCTGPGPRCGDGTRNGSEACDDGNASNSDACLNTCVAARCGDGFMQSGVEACDDGNTVDTDLCTTACAAARCGDGFVQSGVEMCDDGNTINSDSCTAACTPARCGDGFVNAGVEVCDDGASNGMPGYCNASCTVSAGPRCGNGVREGSEECDDGNTSNADACLNTCATARCGDGFAHAPFESCDDGNSSNTDDCLSTCQIPSCGDSFVRAGVELCDEGADNGTYGHCSALCNGPGPRCGDGTTNGPEQCDDANASNTDGCLNTCANARCGDGLVQAGVEMCDDGNTSSTDGCTATCEPARCGDNFVRAVVEMCDDGNMTSGDGCSPLCMIEPIDGGVDAGADAGVDAAIDGGARDAVADVIDVPDAADGENADAADGAASDVADAANRDATDIIDAASTDVAEAGSDASVSGDARADAGGDAGTHAMNSGCGCHAAGRRGGDRTTVAVVLGLALAAVLRRRRTRETRARSSRGSA